MYIKEEKIMVHVIERYRVGSNFWMFQMPHEKIVSTIIIYNIKKNKKIGVKCTTKFIERI